LSASTRVRLSCLLAAATVLVGGCGGQALQTSRPPKTISPTQSTVIFDCGGSAHVEPTELVLACADAGDELAHLHWHGWGDASATANGSLIVETCVPSCVAGATKTYPVKVTVRGLGLEGAHAAYRQLEATSNRGAVPGFGRRLRYSLSATGPAITGIAEPVTPTPVSAAAAK
jgi:hypothetical protein